VNEIEIVLALLFAVALLTTIARRLGIPYPILMVIGGLGLALVPKLPEVELEPELVFLLFLPPILFSAAFFTSWRDFRNNLRPISLLAIGLVLATTGIVAVVARLLIPELGWAGAFALGAIVSPPDAVAATAIAQRLGLPRRLVTILEGESLVNDATALVAVRLAVVAISSGAFSLGEAALSFVWVTVAGVAVGVLVGMAVVWVLGRLSDPPVEIMVTMLAPFAAYLSAEALGGSGVLATVTGGLLLGWRAPRVLTSDARVLGSGAWQILIFVINGLAFILIGLQLPAVVDGLDGRALGDVVLLGAAISAVVIAVRFAWVFPATYLPRLLVPGLAVRDPSPAPRNVVVLAWAGMRGVVSLAAALSLPRFRTDGSLFAERDLLVFLTFCVILVTLVGQGLTLPYLIRWLRVDSDDPAEHEELHARATVTEAALAQLDELEPMWPGHRELIDQLRERYRHRAEHLEHDDEAEKLPLRDQEWEEHRQIRMAVIGAERQTAIELRDRGVISDVVMRRIERDLDLEELQAAEG